MDDEYTRIFVGREKDLDLLSRRFDDRIVGKDPAKVYSYLNAPGIGKTTLLKKFGERIENEGRGLHIYFSCKSRYESEADLNLHLINTLMILIDEKREYILDYIKERSHPEKYLSRFGRLEVELEKVVQTQDYRFFQTTSIIDLLTSLIPVIFSIDEIQRLQKMKVDEEHTMLRSFADFLSDLLPSKVLLTISGTQYSIMSQIGHGIGSPLNGKIQSVVISPLKTGHIRQYITEFRKLYPEQSYTEELENYLLGFSGGHPRTIERIIESFFAIDKAHDFTEILTEEVSTLLSHTILDSNKIEALRVMQSHSEFNSLKEWILHGLNTNLHLGKNPRREMEPLVFELMTMGIIVQNGSSDYYITSYFHGLTFLETLVGEYEQFLYQVLNNLYFREMVGGHSGLGFTFERVIFSSLILHDIVSHEPLNYEIRNLNRIEVRSFKRLSGIKNLEMREDTLYHLPNAEGVDGVFKVDKEIVLIQVTTRHSGIQQKLQSFERGVQELDAKGWFISLYAEDIEETSHSKITMGSELGGILSEKLYQRMLEVKEFLKSKI